MSHQGNLIPGTKRLSNPNSDIKDQCFQEWKAIWLCSITSLATRVHLSETYPDITESHFLEAGNDSQSATMIQEPPEQVFNPSGFTKKEYHWSLGCTGQGREGRKGYTPKRQIEASGISQQGLPTPGCTSMRTELQAGLKLSVASGGQTLETNGINLQLCLDPGLLPLLRNVLGLGSQ